MEAFFEKKVSAWMVRPHAATRDHELRFKRDTATKTVTVKPEGERKPAWFIDIAF